jgi:hypothetical protein
MARAFIIASFSSFALVGAPTTAQNALGDGTALDANQQMGAGRVNIPGPSLQDELRFRNAIVTGNAPGGLSFRGDVGYSAPFEFRGGLGSDTLFTFRRDSFYSGLAGMGIRGTEALQYQFALTTGNEPPPNLRGSLIASRTGIEPTRITVPGFEPVQPGVGGPGAVDLRPIDEASPLADPRGTALWTLRSPAAYDAERRLDPSMITIISGRDGEELGLTASPLRSVTIEPLPRRQRDPQEEEQGEGGPESRFDNFLPAARFESYLSAREPLAAPGGLAPQEGEDVADPAEEHVTSWRRMLDELSAQLQAAELEGPQPGAGVRDPADPRAPAPGQEGPLLAQREMLERLLDEKTVEALQEAPGEYDTLWRPSARDFDAYTVHMRTGENLLAEGRYFEAEERFTRALASKPGDPLAAAGRVHSQIGAGLFVSASLNLRELLTRHPEIIGARYQARLLPQPERRNDLMVRLRATMQRDPESAAGRQSALVLAYLGFHSDDRGAVAEGLERLEAAGDAALAGVLSRVWQQPRSDRGGDDQP